MKKTYAIDVVQYVLALCVTLCVIRDVYEDFAGKLLRVPLFLSIPVCLGAIIVAGFLVVDLVMTRRVERDDDEEQD